MIHCQLISFFDETKCRINAGTYIRNFQIKLTALHKDHVLCGKRKRKTNSISKDK